MTMRRAARVDAGLRRTGIPAIAAAALLCLARPAPAAPASIGLEHVPASSAAVVRADPTELERLAGVVRSLGGELALAPGLVSLASAAALGFDPLSPAGWRAVGLDPERPVLLALAPADPTAPRALWHLRAVALVAEPRAFAEWAVRIPMLGPTWRVAPAGQRSADRAAHPLAAILGGDPRREAGLARELVARGAVAAGLAPAPGALLLVRKVGPFAVIDAFAPAAAGRLVWAEDGPEILDRLEPGPSLGGRTGPAAAVISRAGLAVWVRPAGLLDAALTWARPPASCLAFRDVAPRTALTDGAAALRVAPHQLAVDVTLAIAPGAPLGAAFPALDEGLAGANPRRGEILSAALFLAGTDRLRSLPRPALVRSGWVSLWRRARPCGLGLRAILLGFAWPELSAQWLDDVADTAPQAAALVGALRNAGFAARRVSALDRRGWDAVLEASFAPAGRAPAEAILDGIFGGRVEARRPRPHSAWDGNVLHPYLVARGLRGRRGAVLGVALGDDARRWRLGQPIYRPRRAGVLARFRGDARALLRELGPGLAARRPTAGALAAGVAPRVGSFDAAVTSKPDAIRLTATVRRR